MIITGIGSRETPKAILGEMTKIGSWVREQNHVIRSGHADGADWAFELGAQERCIAYLPWDDFNDHLVSKASLVIVKKNDKYLEITKKFHPNFAMLKSGAVSLMNRNSCQVLGVNLDKYSDFVVCWTSDGKASGGTGQAIRIAEYYKIPVLNMYNERFNSAEKIIEHLNTCIKLQEIVRRNNI